ncbi:MAG: DUF4905 domain-containing protein [Spirosomataceae bacterium]
MSDSRNFRFHLPVWRILYDFLPLPETRSVLVAELRDQTKVEWCAINVETDTLLWQHTFQRADWWTCLIGFYAGKLMLHSYRGTEQPAPHQLLIADALTGATDWTLSENTFDHTDGIIVQTSQLTSEQPLKISYRLLANGKEWPFPPAPITLPTPDWQFPIVYEESNPYYSVIRQFIRKLTNNIPQKAINYGEIAGQLLFFNYLYPANAITLSRSILVVNSTKTILLHETIDSDFGSAVCGECLYNEHHLIYLKKTDELVVLKLPRT